MLRLTMWADLASISTILLPLRCGNWRELALGLISSLTRCTANISDKDIWWREVHSGSGSRLPGPELELCSLDCFRQRAHLDKHCMQCLHAGRVRVGGLAQTRRQVINLCRTFEKHSKLSTYNSSHGLMLVCYIYLSPDHSIASQMFAATRRGGTVASDPQSSAEGIFEKESFTFSLFGIGGATDLTFKVAC